MIHPPRPIKKPRPPAPAPLVGYQVMIGDALAGECLDDLIYELVCCQLDLDLPRIASTALWCDSDPATCNPTELEHLIERLSLVWANSGAGDVGWFE